MDHPIGHGRGTTRRSEMLVMVRGGRSLIQAHGGNNRGEVRDGHFGGSRNQEGWQGRCPLEPRVYNRPPQDQRRPQGKFEERDQGDKHNEQIPQKPVELRERLNLAKDKKGVLDKPNDDQRKMKCFRCQELGHHQKDCVNLPICYKCKEEGHMAAECNEFHSKGGELQMFGFALQDEGFYSIQVPGESSSMKASSIIQALQGEANEKKIDDELKILINRKWNWQVKQVESNKFIAFSLTVEHWIPSRRYLRS
jgi:hypothetical protein